MSAVDQGPPAAGPPPLHRNRDFLLLWSGAAVALLGTRVGTIAYPLLVLWHTGSASASGLVMFAGLLPHLVLQLPAGVLVDRMDRRRLMILSDLGCCLIAGTVAVTVLAGRLWMPLLLAAAFVSGGLSIMYLLAERGGVRNLVTPGQLPAAMTRNETRGRVAGLVGQPAGSLLFAAGRGVPFLFTAVAHAASLAALLLIRKPFQAGLAGTPRRLRADLADGLAWTWRQRLLRTVLGFVAATNILFQVLALAVMVIVQQAGRSPALVGLVVAAGGVGGAAGAATAAWWRRRLDVRVIVVGTFVVWAVLMPWVAVARDPVVLGGLFAVMNYAGGVLNVAGAVYQVQTTPDALQGRVGSVTLLLAAGLTPLGALGGGLAIEAFGVTATVLGIGAVMVLLAGWAALSPAVRRVPDRTHVAPLRGSGR